MKIRRSCLVLLAVVALSIPPAASADSLTLYAAGSLKAALGDVTAAYQKIYQTKVATKFGPSGLLRKAIEQGEKPDVFASANMGHPEKLAADGWGSPVVLFARNKLCALAQPDVAVTTDNLLDVLLDKDILVGTSTPKADPSGDYAWELFRKADRIKAGSFAKLSHKALQLTGGPSSAKAPEGQKQRGNIFNWPQTPCMGESGEAPHSVQLSSVRAKTPCMKDAGKAGIQFLCDLHP